MEKPAAFCPLRISSAKLLLSPKHLDGPAGYFGAALRDVFNDQKCPFAILCFAPRID